MWSLHVRWVPTPLTNVIRTHAASSAREYRLWLKRPKSIFYNILISSSLQTRDLQITQFSRTFYKDRREFRYLRLMRASVSSTREPMKPEQEEPSALVPS